MNSEISNDKISFFWAFILHILIQNTLLKQIKSNFSKERYVISGQSHLKWQKKIVILDIVDQKTRNINALIELSANLTLDRWDRQFVEAQLLMYSGQFYEAARNFEALITVNYKVDDCHQLCGQCDYMIDHFWHAYCHFNKSSIQKEYMIECLFGMRKFDKAQELLTEIEIPEDRFFYLSSQCLFSIKKFQYSGLAISKAIALNPIPLYLNFQDKIYVSCIQLNFSTMNLDGQ
ncbi:hypothetical protein pb186bvf_009039 [Paramecium bursaria]